MPNTTDKTLRLDDECETSALVLRDNSLRRTHEHEDSSFTTLALLTVITGYVIFHIVQTAVQAPFAEDASRHAIIGPGCHARVAEMRLVAFEHSQLIKPLSKEGLQKQDKAAFNAARLAQEMRRALLGSFVDGKGALADGFGKKVWHWSEFCDVKRMTKFFQSSCFVTDPTLVHTLCTTENSVLVCAGENECRQSVWRGLEVKDGRNVTVVQMRGGKGLTEYTRTDQKVRSASCLFVSGYELSSEMESMKSERFVTAKLTEQTLPFSLVGGNVTKDVVREARKVFQSVPWAVWKSVTRKFDMWVKGMEGDGVVVLENEEQCGIEGLRQVVKGWSGRVTVVRDELLGSAADVRVVRKTLNGSLSVVEAMVPENILLHQVLVKELIAKATWCVRVGGTGIGVVDVIRLERRGKICDQTTAGAGCMAKS